MKKHLKIIYPILLAALISQSGCSFFNTKSVSHSDFKNIQPDFNQNSNTVFSEYLNDTELPLSANYYLNDEDENVINAYKRLLYGIQNFYEEIDLKEFELTKDQLSYIYSLINLTAPEIFNITGHYDYTVSLTQKITSLTPYYKMNQELYSEYLDDLNSVADNIVSQSEVYNSDWEKAKFLHDTLILGCDYTENAENIYNAYGCLIDGSAVCEGYSKAYLMLCQKAGIPCLCITGNTTENDTDTSHMWNKIMINNNWYNIDTTWDDPISEIGPDYVRYDYFMITDNEISADHIEDESDSDYPDAVTSGDSYFDKYGFCISDISEASDIFFNSVCNSLINDKNFFEIKCADSNLYKNVYDSILNNETQTAPLFSILKTAAEATSSNISTDSFYISSNDSLNIYTVYLDS